jgi:hypothetical protein
MQTVNIESLPTLDVKTVIDIVGHHYYSDDLSKEFKQSGVYRIMSGSRAYLEEVEFIAPLDSKTIEIPSKEDAVRILSDGDDSEINELKEYVDEYYGFEIEKNFMTFGFTEEEFDYYFKVQV